MKTKKLNARGFSHEVLILLFVIVFAVAGAAYLVATHAQTPTASTASYKCNRHTWAKGSRGHCVKDIQYAVAFAAPGGKLTLDSTFGSQTQGAVKKFQKLYRINPNGVVASQTWAHICGNLQQGKSRGSVTAARYGHDAGCF